jgi:hypothetical protein
VQYPEYFNAYVVVPAAGALVVVFPEAGALVVVAGAFVTEFVVVIVGALVTELAPQV